MLNRFQQSEGKNRTPLKSIADRLSTFQKEVNEGLRAEVAALEHREAETTEPKRRDKFLRIAVPRSQRTSSRVAFIAFRRRECVIAFHDRQRTPYPSSDEPYDLQVDSSVVE